MKIKSPRPKFRLMALFKSGPVHVPLIIAVLFFLLPGLGALGEPPREIVALPSTADLLKTLKGQKAGDPARYLDIFSPLRTDKAALSPDGRLLAYTVQTDKALYIHIVAVDQPEVLKTRLLVMAIDEPRGGLFPRLFFPMRWMRWVTPTRLVFNTNHYIRSLIGEFNDSKVTAINADGSDELVLAKGDGFKEIALGVAAPCTEIRVVGLDPDRPNSIILTTVAQKYIKTYMTKIYGAHAFNVFTGKQTELGQTLIQGYPNRVANTLLDGRGRGRLTINTSMDFPQPFVYLPPNKSARERPLDSITRLSGFSLSPDTYFNERAVPLGFDLKDDILYYASNVGRDTFGIYAWDLKGKKRLPLAFENPVFDLYTLQPYPFGGGKSWGNRPLEDFPPDGGLGRCLPSSFLVTDRFTQRLAGVRYEGATRTAMWLRPELQAVQDWLTANRPGRSAEILEWDESLNRLLVLEQGPADTGTFHVLDRKQRTYTQFARRGSDPEAGAMAQVLPFAFTLPDGSRIDGVLALPRNPRLKKAPLILLCPDQPWQRRGASSEQLPELEAFTRMGLAVALYNGRGAWGTGIRERKKMQAGYEEVQAADLVAVADHLAEKFNLSRKRVGLFGQGDGGFVALRALQLHPDSFRCAVTIEPRIDRYGPRSPFRDMYGDTASEHDAPLVSHPELIRAPVFILASRDAHTQFHANSRLHAALERTAPDSEFLEIPVPHHETSGTPQAVADQWARIDSFLNYVLYDYKVNFGDFQVLPDQPLPPPKP